MIQGQQEGIYTRLSQRRKNFRNPYLRGQKHGMEVRYKDGPTIVEEVTLGKRGSTCPRNILLDETPQTEWYHQGE